MIFSLVQRPPARCRRRQNGIPPLQSRQAPANLV
jgi:hypothetical protein